MGVLFQLPAFPVDQDASAVGIEFACLELLEIIVDVIGPRFSAMLPGEGKVIVMLGRSVGATLAMRSSRASRCISSLVPSDALQGCHWTASLVKRWLLGTHAGARCDFSLSNFTNLASWLRWATW